MLCSDSLGFRCDSLHLLKAESAPPNLILVDFECLKGYSEYPYKWGHSKSAEVPSSPSCLSCEPVNFLQSGEALAAAPLSPEPAPGAGAPLWGSMDTDGTLIWLVDSSDTWMRKAFCLWHPYTALDLKQISKVGNASICLWHLNKQ